MKRIGKVLHSWFSRLPFVRARRDESRPTVTASTGETPTRPKDETAAPPQDEDRLLALRLRKAVEDGRLFLRPRLTPADVAAELGIEMDTLERIFAHFIGESFHHYLNELRIAYAAVLFMGHESHLYSIEKIGTECGFPDTDAFTNACHTLTGMTPEVMREFTRGRKTLKGLFLNPPAYTTLLSFDALEEDNTPEEDTPNKNQ